MTRKAIVSLLILFSSFLMYAHPLKMTVSKLTLKTDKQEIGYIINLFIDDFKPVLKEHYSYEEWDFDGLTENEIRLMAEYINQNISVTINKSAILIHQIDVKVLEENICQIQFKDTWSGSSKIDYISYSNTILMKEYATQSNILHIIVNDSSKKTYNLKKGKAFIEINF